MSTEKEEKRGEKSIALDGRRPLLLLAGE